MSQTGQDLTALVDELRGLTARRAPLSQKLQAIEDRKGSTPPSVVERVRRETLEKLEAIDADLRGRLDEARRAKSELAGQKAMVTADLDRRNEELEELRFRRTLGEFSDDDFNGQESAKLREIDETRARLQPLDEIEFLLTEVLSMAERTPAEEHVAEPRAGQELEAMFGSAPYAPESPRAMPPEVSRSAPTYIPPSPSHEISRPVERRTTAAFPALGTEGDAAGPTQPAPRSEPSASEPAASGPVRPVLIVKTKDKDRGEDTYDLSVGQTLVGRAPENDIILLEESVSRRHARLIVEGAECFLEDLGSANGSYVNGERLRPKQPRKLQDNDVVKLGQLLALFRLNPED